MKLTSALFEAYLKCPTKCYLRSTGQTGVGNAYADWVREQNDAYRKEAVQRLVTAAGDGVAATTPGTDNLKTATWRLAVDLPLETETMASSLHAVERVPSQGRGRPAEFIPIRFVFFNKLTKDDRLLVAFDALILSEVLGREVGMGKIVHGDDHATLKVKAASLLETLRKLTAKMSVMLSAGSPPDLILNRHCGECGFRDGCRQKAVEKDDLSLLGGMTEKERKKYHSKGIFTVTQLSYTFRPRRRPKHLRDKRERYHHALKALAIREKKIHIVGSPELKIEGTPVYLDVEGLPDRNFYYLIGVRIGNGESAVQHSLWADTVEDELNIWRGFLAILETVPKPVLVHYGRYESEFLKGMSERYSAPTQDMSVDLNNQKSINLHSVLLDQLYFPTHTNSLKEVGAWLGFVWSKAAPVGVNSVACRCEWERTHDPSLKARLIAYNAEDCQAAEIVAEALIRLHPPDPCTESAESAAEAVYVRSLRRPQRRWGNFVSPFKALEEINATASWDYQRDRIYVKSKGAPPRKISPAGSRWASWLNPVRVNKIIDFPGPISCPVCGGLCAEHSRSARTLHDLSFGKSYVKRWVVRFRFHYYWCCVCRKRFGMPHEFWQDTHFGRNLVAFVLYLTFELNLPFVTVQRILSRFFALNMPVQTLILIRKAAAREYEGTRDRILQRLVNGTLLHADETEVSIRGKPAYVWVFTNLHDVVYLYAAGREGAFLHEMLKDFKGVLVSDFYGAYDSLDCPQQKCLIHLIRDLNDEVLVHPYDEELKAIVSDFASLLKPIVETIDRRGLKRRFLQKHQPAVKRFYRKLAKLECVSDAAIKCKQRFEKNRHKLFTFLSHDGVPWNNNNAEHAVKVFAQLRDIVRGSFTEDSVSGYLVLLSICQTCKCSGLDFFDFLRSGENDIHAFAESQHGRRRQQHPIRPEIPPAVEDSKR